MLNSVLSEEDYRVWNWLSIIREPDKLRINVDERSRCITAWCKDFYAARELWRSRHLLDSDNPSLHFLLVYVKDRLYASGSIQCKPQNLPKDMNLSVWAKQNKALIHALPGSVFLHSTESGFKFLAVKPDISENRLNRPILNLIGQPLRTTDERIALPKERAIQAVIATGETQTYGYDYHWKDLLWQFEVSVIPLPDTAEVLVMVQDSNQSVWQRGYWLNVLS